MIDRETFISDYCKNKQREYYRSWREKNRDKVINYQNSYWRKQAIAEYERQTNNKTIA